MHGEHELRRRINEELRDVYAPRPPLQEVLQRSRILRTRRYLVGTALAVFLVAGIVLPLMLLAPLGGKPARLMPGGTTERDVGDSATREDEVRVVCEEQTFPELLTSSVVRQPNGVHFRLSNPGGAHSVFAMNPQNPQQNWGRTTLADEDFKRFTLPIPPGDVLVACLHDSGSILELPREGWAPLTILPSDDPTVSPTATPTAP